MYARFVWAAPAPAPRLPAQQEHLAALAGELAALRRQLAGLAHERERAKARVADVRAAADAARARLRLDEEAAASAADAARRQRNAALQQRDYLRAAEAFVADVEVQLRQSSSPVLELGAGPAGPPGPLPLTPARGQPPSWGGSWGDSFDSDSEEEEDAEIGLWLPPEPQRASWMDGSSPPPPLAPPPPPAAAPVARRPSEDAPELRRELQKMVAVLHEATDALQTSLVRRQALRADADALGELVEVLGRRPRPASLAGLPEPLPESGAAAHWRAAAAAVAELRAVTERAGRAMEEVARVAGLREECLSGAWSA